MFDIVGEIGQSRVAVTDFHLGEFEQLVLLALMRLGDNAYGVTVREELLSQGGREASLGTVYKTLERLQEKGCVSTRIGQPTAERGGRRKKFYRVEPLGARALERSLQALRRMAEGLDGEAEVP